MTVMSVIGMFLAAIHVEDDFGVVVIDRLVLWPGALYDHAVHAFVLLEAFIPEFYAVIEFVFGRLVAGGSGNQAASSETVDNGRVAWL